MQRIPRKGGPAIANVAEITEARPSSVLVLGLGNPILGDDGVGWRVAESVRSVIGQGPGTPDVDCAALGGLSLMERMLGYEHVVLIDSMSAGSQPHGEVSMYRLDELPNPGDGHTASPHDTSLATALRTAHALGAAIPSRVDVVAIETAASYDFSEQLSPEVEAAIALATQKVLGLVSGEDNGSSVP